MSTETRAQRLLHARQAAGFKTAAGAADHFNWNRNTYSSNENGNAAYSYRAAREYAAAFGVTPQWLYDGIGAPKADAAEEPAPGPILVPVIGRGGGPPARGVRRADDGGLIYFEAQQTPPTPDMFGHVVVVETLEGEVLVKRLLRGSRSGRFDLESMVGPTRENCKLRWAAHITAIIPPHQARRILRSSNP